MDLPDSITGYIKTWFVRHHTLGYFLLDQRGRVRSSGGALAQMGIDTIARGRPAEDQLHFLTGVLPLSEEELRLPMIKTKTDRSVDVHIFKSGDSRWRRTSRAPARPRG